MGAVYGHASRLGLAAEKTIISIRWIGVLDIAAYLGARLELDLDLDLDHYYLSLQLDPVPDSTPNGPLRNAG